MKSPYRLYVLALFIVFVICSSNVFADKSLEKTVTVTKIENFSEASDSIITDSGDFILQVYNKQYKKIIKKLKSHIGKKITLILNEDGMIVNVK